MEKQHKSRDVYYLLAYFDGPTASNAFGRFHCPKHISAQVRAHTHIHINRTQTHARTRTRFPLPRHISGSTAEQLDWHTGEFTNAICCATVVWMRLFCVACGGEWSGGTAAKVHIVLWRSVARI